MEGFDPESRITGEAEDIQDTSGMNGQNIDILFTKPWSEWHTLKDLLHDDGDIEV